MELNIPSSPRVFSSIGNDAPNRALSALSKAAITTSTATGKLHRISHLSPHIDDIAHDMHGYFADAKRFIFY